MVPIPHEGLELVWGPSCGGTRRLASGCGGKARHVYFDARLDDPVYRDREALIQIQSFEHATSKSVESASQARETLVLLVCTVSGLFGGRPAMGRGKGS